VSKLGGVESSLLYVNKWPVHRCIRSTSLLTYTEGFFFFSLFGNFLLPMGVFVR
jgi:hypothetical protein